jgi:glucose-6-phosphate 1-dehydrogenase
MASTFQNTEEKLLQENSSASKQAEPCILVIFGATGDLTARKLVPAIYNLQRENLLPANFACVGFARRKKSNEEFRQEMHEAVSRFSRNKPIDDKIWENFSEQLFYHESNFDSDEGYDGLNKYLKELDEKLGTRGNRVFYLSTQPSFFPEIVEKLKKHDLIYEPDDESGKWSRVIIEKPFGHDHGSAVALQKHIMQYLNESQVYRIDHYLGKETVQNLLVFRFANSIFESIWNNRHIDNVQITVAEDIGIGTRGRFWEEAGMLRDIVQNHMMQLLSLVAMEPPVNLNANSIRDEKVKVVQSIRPIDMDQLGKYVVRGQYGPGYINGENVSSYREEDNVARDSSVETYVAMQLYIDNWRWAGVPFYLRAGKRLPKRATEIAINFKEAPGFLFKQENKKPDSNVLVIRIQPDEGISLKMNCKVPGMNGPIQPVKMDFRYGSYFGATPPEAYERLICDCMADDSTLFARSDEVVASWNLITPILERWQEEKPSNFPNYEAGTYGPREADLMLARENHSWRLL